MSPPSWEIASNLIKFKIMLSLMSSSILKTFLFPNHPLLLWKLLILWLRMRICNLVLSHLQKMMLIFKKIKQQLKILSQRNQLSQKSRSLQMKKDLTRIQFWTPLFKKRRKMPWIITILRMTFMRERMLFSGRESKVLRAMRTFKKRNKKYAILYPQTRDPLNQWFLILPWSLSTDKNFRKRCSLPIFRRLVLSFLRLSLKSLKISLTSLKLRRSSLLISEFTSGHL